MTHDLYRLVIADDERTIRRGLSNYGRWQELGYQIVAVYEDGEGVVQHLEKGLGVDVILTDIVMDDRSGLDILKYIRTNRIDVKTVLLSAYSEFEIAQEAISLGASAYLLKPTVISELRETFTTIKQELDARREAKETRLMRTLWLEKLLLFATTNPGFFDIDELWNLIGFEKPRRDYYWVYVSLDLDDGDTEKINDVGMEGLLKNSLDVGKDWIVISDMVGCTVNVMLLVPRITPVSICENVAAEKVSMSIAAIKELFDCEIAVREMHTGDTWSDLQSHLGVQKDRNAAQQIHTGCPFTSEALYRAVSLGDYAVVRSFLDYAADHPEQTYAILVKILIMLYMQLAKYHAPPEVDFRIDTVEHLLNQDDNADAVIQYVNDTIGRLEEFLGDRREIVTKVCEYIHSNVGNGVALQATADHFGYNASYLSRLFKASTGESFSAYVRKHKILHAKALLCNNQLRVYEVSEKLGYRDVRHFYKVFKNETGTTPAKYRQTISSDSGTSELPDE